MMPWHSLRTHAKWYDPCHERVEECDVEDLEDEIDREGLCPGKLLASWMVIHYGYMVCEEENLKKSLTKERRRQERISDQWHHPLELETTASP
jgi:hypothetical protein